MTLPHKVLQPEEFDQQTLRIRNNYFSDKDSKEFALKPEYHRKIPADGLSHYLETIWVRNKISTISTIYPNFLQDKVQNNKDLDVPTQQELLAQYRCDEIASETLKIFHNRIISVKKPVEIGKFVPELGKVMRDAEKEALGLSQFQ